jgi:phage-related protein
MVVHFYLSSRGDAYVMRLVESVDRLSGAEILKAARMLRDFGHMLGMPYSKALGGGLFELRIQGRRQFRVFYGLDNGEAWLLHAIEKKTQKTPPADMRLARKRLSEVTR